MLLDELAKAREVLRYAGRRERKRAISRTLLVKGLEYDHVIVVEPADIVAAEPRGLNRLYVALTRAVAGLVVLHRQPLPAALRD